jgi:hypothetical protein
VVVEWVEVLRMQLEVLEDVLLVELELIHLEEEEPEVHKHREEPEVIHGVQDRMGLQVHLEPGLQVQRIIVIITHPVAVVAAVCMVAVVVVLIAFPVRLMAVEEAVEDPLLLLQVVAVIKGQIMVQDI